MAVLLPLAPAGAQEETPPAPAAPDAAAFAPARRVLRATCAMPGCHAGPDAAMGLRLDAERIYRSTVNVPSRTDPAVLRVAPGDAERSMLYLKLLPPEQGRYRGPRMPHGMDALTDDAIALVRRWIEAFPAETWGPAPEGPAGGSRGGRVFLDSHLANLPAPDPLGDGTLEFRIVHRFKDAASDAGGESLYGIDSGAWVSFGLAYGLTRSIDVGLRRTNFQPIGRDYEAHAAWAPWRPPDARVSLAFRGSYSTIRGESAANRGRAGAQVIVGRRFGERFAALLAPTWVSRANALDPEDDRGSAAVGVGVELRLTGRMAITGEWLAQVSGFKAPYQGATLGFNIATARHGFHIVLTNTAGIHTDLYAPGGDLDLGGGDFRLGFNISRTFRPGR